MYIVRYIGYIQIESQTSEIIAGRECEGLVSGVLSGSPCFQVGGEATRHVRGHDVSNHTSVQ